MKKLIILSLLFLSCKKHQFNDVIPETSYKIQTWALCVAPSELFRYSNFSYLGGCWCQELFLSCCPSGRSPMTKIGSDSAMYPTPFGERIYVYNVYSSNDSMIRGQWDLVYGVWYYEEWKFFNTHI